ncbi:MAG TPA: four helix bundle protein [Lentisphaeria bacterium]|nr:four helix bundle protein [Lentisphaeria bacterium]
MDKKIMNYNLEKRTKTFAINIIKFINSNDRNIVSDVLLKQLLRSATSIGANYREANRAESKKDFIHKISIVLKETSETNYWLELLSELDLHKNSELKLLLKESSELLAIFTTIHKKSKSPIP